MGAFNNSGITPEAGPKIRLSFSQQASAAGGGIFRNIRTAREKYDGDYIRPGHYIVRIDRTKEGRDRQQIPYCLVSATVVAVIDDNLGQSQRVGDEVVQVWKLSSYYFGSEVRAFTSAVCGVCPESVTDEEFEGLTAAVFCGDNPLAGFPVEMKAYTISIMDKDDPDKKRVKDFTRVRWIRCVPAAELLGKIDESVQERFWPGGGLQRLAEAEAHQNE